VNRRMLRTTYHVEIEEINFTHGLPAWMTESPTGPSTASTHDYSDPYGSHYSMTPRGKAGDGVSLIGSPMSTSVVKVLEMEAIGVTAAGPVELSLGLASQLDEAASIRLDAVPADSGVASAGQVRLVLQDGTSKGETTLFAAGSAGTHRPTDIGTVIEDLDLAVIVDSEKKMAQAHLGYSYVSCGPQGFPVGQVLTPMVKAVLLAGGEASVKVRRVVIGTYT
jgi:hypothetical protein